jgi:hypothetical protein
MRITALSQRPATLRPTTAANPGVSAGEAFGEMEVRQSSKFYPLPI